MTVLFIVCIVTHVFCKNDDTRVFTLVDHYFSTHAPPIFVFFFFLTWTPCRSESTPGGRYRPFLETSLCYFCWLLKKPWKIERVWKKNFFRWTRASKSLHTPVAKSLIAPSDPTYVSGCYYFDLENGTRVRRPRASVDPKRPNYSRKRYNLRSWVWHGKCCRKLVETQFRMALERPRLERRAQIVGRPIRTKTVPNYFSVSNGRKIIFVNSKNNRFASTCKLFEKCRYRLEVVCIYIR